MPWEGLVQVNAPVGYLHKRGPTHAGIQVVQCIVYDSGRQRVEPLTKLACGVMVGLAAGCAA